LFLLGTVRAEFPYTTFAYSANVTTRTLQIKQFNLSNINTSHQFFLQVLLKFIGALSVMATEKWITE